MTSQDLVPGINAQDLMTKRDDAFAKARRGLELLAQADQDLDGMWAAIFSMTNYQHREAISADGIDRLLEAIRPRLDARCWNRLLNASGLRSFMDPEACRQWDGAIERNDTPALEVGSIQATFRNLHEERHAMLERRVVSAIRRVSRDPKTRQPRPLGAKVIVEDFLNRYGALTIGQGGVEDLLCLMCLFDGKPETDNHEAIVNAHVRGSWQWSNEYVDLKWFKNGNAHVVFKRPDLVDKLNQVLAQRCPEALAAA